MYLLRTIMYVLKSQRVKLGIKYLTEVIRPVHFPISVARKKDKKRLQVALHDHTYKFGKVAATFNRHFCVKYRGKLKERTEIIGCTCISNRNFSE